MERKKFRFPISKKARKIIIVTIGVIVGLYLLLMIGLSIYISSSKERLLSFINSKIKETILGELKINNADIKTRLTGSKYRITFDEDLFLRGLGFNLAQGYWLENKRIKAKWKLEFD